MSRQYGTIRHWKSEKGYGFVDVSNGGSRPAPDVFLHISGWHEKTEPHEGDYVSFRRPWRSATSR
jgi:cold shock CspA family protein